MEAIDRPGTFLDVGCANGLLMASVARWSRGRRLPVETYGVETG
jgi:2-polyprenyl-3-methyl-5-hydroxy-6-metoxy-1,4-benzoquinol methylase